MLVLFFCLNASCCIYKKERENGLTRALTQNDSSNSSWHHVTLYCCQWPKLLFFLDKKVTTALDQTKKNLTTMKKRQAELVLCLTTKFFMFVRQQVTFLLRSCSQNRPQIYEMNFMQLKILVWSFSPNQESNSLQIMSSLDLVVDRSNN